MIKEYSRDDWGEQRERDIFNAMNQQHRDEQQQQHWREALHWLLAYRWKLRWQVDSWR